MRQRPVSPRSSSPACVSQAEIEESHRVALPRSLLGVVPGAHANIGELMTPSAAGVAQWNPTRST
jgi:hypothetical protein